MMNPDEFIGSSSGTIIPTVEGQMAFVPNSLPPAINYPAIMEAFEKAAMAIGELNKAGQQLENPYLVINPLQRQEALRSSDMEGTYTTANALVLAEADEEKYVDPPAIEVRNYIRAFNYAQDKLDELPLSGRLIKGIHEKLLQNVQKKRGANQRPGEYKNSQNFIGGSGRQMKDARFIPPPPKEAEDAMADLERYLNREESGGISPLIDAALIHYQFETIHPFSDGNGRVGRILIPIHLMAKGVLEKPLLFISPVVEGKKEEYVDSMLTVSKTGDWDQWLNFFLSAIVDACSNSNKTIERLIALRDRFRSRMAEIGMSARNLSLADQMFVSPVISIPEAANHMGVTYAAAKNTVERMTTLGILRELDFTSQPRQYICMEVLRATDPDFVDEI